MDQNTTQIVLWLAGGIGAVITGLITWIGIMQRESKEQNKEIITLIREKNTEQDDRLNKHDEKFDKVHEEIKTLAVSIAAGGRKQKKG